MGNGDRDCILRSNLWKSPITLTWIHLLVICDSNHLYLYWHHYLHHQIHLRTRTMSYPPHHIHYLLGKGGWVLTRDRCACNHFQHEQEENRKQLWMLCHITVSIQKHNYYRETNITEINNKMMVTSTDAEWTWKIIVILSKSHNGHFSDPSPRFQVALASRATALPSVNKAKK